MAEQLVTYREAITPESVERAFADVLRHAYEKAKHAVHREANGRPTRMPLVYVEFSTFVDTSEPGTSHLHGGLYG